MATYGVQIWALSDATVSHAGIIEEHYDGLQWEWYSHENNTFTLNGGASPTQVTIEDSTPSTFDEAADEQATTAEATIGGTTYPSGTLLKDEYEIDLTDGATTYRMVAVAVREYSSPYIWQDTIIGFTFDGPAPPPDTELSYVVHSAVEHQSMVPCFTPGALVDTPSGPRPVEALRAGDRVCGADGGLHRLIWTGRSRVSAGRLAREPGLRPVRIAPGALGPGKPDRALVVSPQHRLLVRSAVAAWLGGAPEVLVAVKHLVGLPGVAVIWPPQGVTYVHLLTARHLLLLVNGAETETLYPGPQALRALSLVARLSLRALVHEAPGLVRPALPGRLARDLAARHARHRLALQ